VYTKKQTLNTGTTSTQFNFLIQRTQALVSFTLILCCYSMQLKLQKNLNQNLGSHVHMFGFGTKF
jgi:hypothetical protein